MNQGAIIPFGDELEWLAAKAGMFGASKVNGLLAPGKRLMTEAELLDWKKENPKSTAKYIEDDSTLSEGALTLCLEIFSERVAKDVVGKFLSFDMQYGKDTEPKAYQEVDKLFPYEEILHFGGSQYLFIKYNDYSGASPDILCLGKWGAEVKCPTTKRIHIERILQVHDNQSLKQHDKDIYAQIQFNMMCAKLNKWLFVSYYEGMNDKSLVTHIVDILPDKDFQKLIHNKLEAAEKEVQRLMEAFKAKSQPINR